MVPKNKEKGLIQGGYDEIEVIHGEVSGAEDKAYVGKTLFYGRRVNNGVDYVRNTEYFQCLILDWCTKAKMPIIIIYVPLKRRIYTQ